MEALRYVDGDVVDVILHGALLQFLLLLFHLLPIGGGYLIGLQPQASTAFEVYEKVGSATVVEV